MRRLLALAPILVILPLAQAQAAPQGSYRRSCTNEEQRGPIVSAVCKGRNGRRFDTQIDLRRCRGEDIGNTFGRLTCGYVQGQARPHDDDDDDDRQQYDPPRRGYGQPEFGAPPPFRRGYGRPGDDDDFAPPPPRGRRYYDPDQDQ